MPAATIYDLTLQDLLAPSIAGDAGMQQAAQALTPELADVTASIRLARLYARLDELSGPVLDLLAWQLHVDFWRPELPDTSKRNLIRRAIGWHRIKGTPAAIRRLFADIGVDAEMIEWWQPAGVAAGMPAYTFAVRGLLRQPVLTTESWGPATIDALEEAVAAGKNERSWLWWLSLALEIEAPLVLGLDQAARCRDRTRLLLALGPLFDRTRLDVRVLDEDHPTQTWRVRDTAQAALALGRPWRLDSLAAEDGPWLGGDGDLDGMLPGCEGMPEPPLNSLARSMAASPLPAAVTLAAAAGWGLGTRSNDIPLEFDLAGVPLQRAACTAPFGMEPVGLDASPAFDAVPLDVYALDVPLEVTHA